MPSPYTWTCPNGHWNKDKRSFCTVCQSQRLPADKPDVPARAHQHQWVRSSNGTIYCPCGVTTAAIPPGDVPPARPAKGAAGPKVEKPSDSRPANTSQHQHEWIRMANGDYRCKCGATHSAYQHGHALQVARAYQLRQAGRAQTAQGWSLTKLGCQVWLWVIAALFIIGLLSSLLGK